MGKKMAVKWFILSLSNGSSRRSYKAVSKSKSKSQLEFSNLVSFIHTESRILQGKENSHRGDGWMIWWVRSHIVKEVTTIYLLDIGPDVRSSPFLNSSYFACWIQHWPTYIYFNLKLKKSTLANQTKFTLFIKKN